MAKKKLTILHSNDLHGDFLPEDKDGLETGGLSRLAGYVRQARAKEKNVIYANAGDMFRGSIIDSEYLGLSTIDLMNSLSPDVTTVGNHEVDYGVAHLLFLEKCARFPIINANLFVTLNNARLFEPYLTLNVDGMQIMFIGILTEEVIASTKNEKVIGTFIDTVEAAKEVGIICDNYRTRKTDMVILLTHIGIEEDRKLARLLNPDWGVDLIIGGHSHTFMEAPEIVNGIPIVQVGRGTDQIGRFDIEIDTDEHKMVSYQWECIPIDSRHCPIDPILESVLNSYKERTDRIYGKIVTNFKRKLTHPSRYQETELGNLFADLLQVDSSFEVMLMGSGSIRLKEMGPIVQFQELKECVPYNAPVYMLEVSGQQFRRMMRFMLRDEMFVEGSHGEFYQVSKGMKMVYDRKKGDFEEFSLNGEEIADDRMVRIALQDYHFKNFTEFFNVPVEEVIANKKPRMVITDDFSIFEELLSSMNNVDSHVEGRITIK